LTVAIFNYKTHLKKKFSVVFSHLPSKFVKIANLAQIFMSSQKCNMGIKKAEFDADFNPLEICKKILRSY
jgi:hypothetical protein